MSVYERWPGPAVPGSLVPTFCAVALWGGWRGAQFRLLQRPQRPQPPGRQGSEQQGLLSRAVTPGGRSRSWEGTGSPGRSQTAGSPEACGEGRGRGWHMEGQPWARGHEPHPARATFCRRCPSGTSWRPARPPRSRTPAAVATATGCHLVLRALPPALPVGFPQGGRQVSRDGSLPPASRRLKIEINL